MPPYLYKPSVAIVWEDNAGAIDLTVNRSVNKRTKHMRLRYHFIRELQREGVLFYKWIPTDEQPADMLTKSLCAEKVRKFVVTIMGAQEHPV